MRLLIALLLVLGLTTTAVAPLAAAGDAGSVVALLQQPGQYDVDIRVPDDGGAWWTDPVWIGAGVVALVLLIVIVALATRGGGGTTIVKE